MGWSCTWLLSSTGVRGGNSQGELKFEPSWDAYFLTECYVDVPPVRRLSSILSQVTDFSLRVLVLVRSLSVYTPVVLSGP